METNNSDKLIPNLTVVSSYFYPKIGGLETIAYTTAKDLHKSGKYNVSIITSNYDGTGYKKEIIDGMNVHRLPISFKFSNSPINLLWYFTIKKIYKAENTNLVHTHSPVPYMVDVAISAAKSMGIPTVATYHSGSMKKGRFFIDIVIGIYENFFLRRMLKKATQVVTVHKAFMKNNYPEVDYKTSFIPTGVDLNRFQKTPIDPNKKIATFIGRIEMSSMWKGINQLIPAMALVVKEIPDAKLQLVGGGDALEYYRDMAKKSGIEDSVVITGPKYANELVDIYKGTTLVVLPSTSDSEAFSVTLVESMASGRPIIGTNMGGTPQVITNEKNGLLIPAKDPKALADAIIKILNNPIYAQKLGDAGSEISKDFSWETQTNKYDNLFKKVLKI